MDYRANPLAPIPKLYIPPIVAAVVILLSWVISGDFGPAELASLLTAAGYFVIGYVVPTDGVGLRREGARRTATERYRSEPPTRGM
jgi:hypothetical protein